MRLDPFRFPLFVIALAELPKVEGFDQTGATELIPIEALERGPWAAAHHYPIEIIAPASG
jgi:hypothetical protein